ncbi:class I SAM-dependent methyltransferase [Chloroflexota bacterium]
MVIRRYFNHKATTWDEEFPKGDATIIRQMAERLAIKPGSIILDVGTGTGAFLGSLLYYTGNKGQIIALDFASKMLKKARSKGFPNNICYVCADITSIPMRPETFDTIVCHNSFPHFHNKLKALTEMKRVTKKGGRIFVCHTANRKKINSIHQKIPKLINDTIPDESEMRNLVFKAGLSKPEIDDCKESYFASTLRPLE